MKLWARITYVDGEHQTVSTEDWAGVRADGVDRVEVGHENEWVSFAGHSIYWLRHEGDRYVLGAASFYENQASEVVFLDEGQEERRLLDSEIPDLHHDEVKLGWWWPGG